MEGPEPKVKHSKLIRAELTNMHSNFSTWSLRTATLPLCQVPRPIDGAQQTTQLPFLFNPQQGQGDQNIQPLAPPEGFPQYLQSGVFGQQGERKDVQYPERPGQPECQVWSHTFSPQKRSIG